MATFSEAEFADMLALDLLTLRAHTEAAVMGALMNEVRTIVASRGIRVLQSNVYKTNTRSLGFHRKLGFSVTRENDRGLELPLALPETAS